MKEQAPAFYNYDPQTNRRTLNLPPFLNYLTNITSPQFAHKHGKNIQQHLTHLAKTPESEQHVLQIIRFFCLQFKNSRSVTILQLLRSAICVDLKYEAKSQGDSYHQEENIKMVDNNEVIALPYGPAAPPTIALPYGPALPPTMVMHSPEPMSDVIDQRKHGDSKNYYSQDNQNVVQYLKEKFRVVKREGISTVFGQAAEIIIIQLFEGLIEEMDKMAPSALVQLLKVLDYITPPLYTFYLLHLTQQITQKVCLMFQEKETEKRCSKVEVEAIVSTLRNITDRWAESQPGSVQSLQWALQTRIISLFMSSQVSQKKLYAVKLLCEICRRSQYSASTISQEVIEKFITEKGLLQQIYRADNHPQVITKGEEVFLYLVKDGRLTQSYINIIFNLLGKCHQHLSKSLFVTLQRVGHKNIEDHRKQLLKKIEEMPRATCFNEETFTLIESIMISTPSSQVEGSLAALYRIMEKNYDHLKENLKAKAVVIYFQVFIMGIEQEVFDHSNAMLTLKPILHHPNSGLFSFMIENFIFRLKDQYSKSIGHKCKKTLHSAIRLLITEEKIHKFQIDDQKKHLKILNLLLENYEELDQNLMSSEDLWELIKLDRQFSKFLKFYPQDIQISLISHLISSEGKSPYDIECIIDLYHLMNSEVKAVLAPLLYEDYFKTHSLVSKYLLARHILEVQSIPIKEVVNHMEQNPSNTYQTLSWIILLREIVKKEDEKGFGLYPPYQDLRNSYDITVKVINSRNVFDPIQSEIKVKNYLNLYELTQKALNGQDINFNNIKLKLNDQHLTLNQIKEKISNLTPYRNITLDIEQTAECEWFNKDILFNKQGLFTNQIIEILKEIFNKSASRDGKLRASAIAKIFEKATGTQVIYQNDSRVLYIFNNYSSNGDYIKLDEWINFYYQSALKNAPVVIDNMKKLGFGHLLRAEQNLEVFFNDENTLRNYINSDKDIYHIIFKTYQQLIRCSAVELHNDIIKEFTSTLKLFPASSHIISCLHELSTNIFQYQIKNTLYYWYVANMLESLYFQNITIQNPANWKDSLMNSFVFQKLLIIYEDYLYKILSNGPSKYQVNIDLEIFIIQSLGKVLRGKFSDIPSLVSQSVQFATLSEPGSGLTHITQPMLSYIPQLGQLCTNICRGKRDQQIAQNAVAIVLDMARSSQSKFKIEVIQSLIFSDILTVRQIFNLFYYLLSSIHPAIKKQYYSIHITKDTKATYKHCQEYFFILNKLLFKEDDDQYYKEISKLYQKEISEEKYIQNLADNNQTDQILLGKLKILNEIKIYNPQTQINTTTISSIKQLLQNSLSEQVREILYSMTNSICDVEYSLQLMIKIMEQTNLKRNSVHRGKKKMGIMNLGCICYINSVLQQLQMIQPFRRGIIGTEVTSDVIDFFREFQYLIYQLTFGQRIFLIPQNFCLNYLDSSNMPINIKEQHDADEFLNQLFDKLQLRLKNTNQDHLINKNFKGELVNVINCEKCYHKKEKIENFYILTVQIKNQSNLKDCLNKLIQPQIICDYFCDFCEGKVQTIQKYNRFHCLPPFLFIHLQRLVFDLQTFTKIKLDHPVSFPTEINLQDFFNQQVEPQLYILKGFVVHVGNSQGGHYYSIIKCQNGWIKFDDTRIDDWDWNRQSQDRDNAYLLIYERKKQATQVASQQLDIGNHHIMNIVQEDINFLMKEKIFLQASFTRYLISTLKKIHIPQEYISNPNQQGNPYQPNFAQLPKELQEQLDLAFEAIVLYIRLQSEMKQLRVNVSFNDMVNNQSAVYKQSNQLQAIVYYMICVLHIRPKLAFSAVEYFIKDGPSNFMLPIYLHNDRIIRQAFKTILTKVTVVIAASISKDLSFLVPIPQNEVINKMLQKIMMGLNEVGKNPMKMLEYFSLILDMCKMDKRFVEWFQANKLGPRLIHFYLQKQSGLQALLPAYPYYMSTDRRVDSIGAVIEILNFLVEYEPDLSEEREETLIERKAYLNMQLYRRFINDRYQNQNITNIFKYAARNQKISEKLLTMVVENLNRFNHDDQYIYTYVHTMYALLTINDGLQRRRIQRLFGVPILTILGQNDDNRYLANTPTDRVCKYWNPCFMMGDQIIFSFLELLYTNRGHHSYFTMLGIMCLFRLMATVPEVNRYVSELPGPCLASQSYIEWINQFVFNFEKTEKEDNNSRISGEQKHLFLQEIVKYLRQMEINQEKQTESQLLTAHKELSKTRELYHIGAIKNYSKWEQVQFQFFQNLIIFNSQNIEQINNVGPADIISIKYRILYCADDEEMQDCAKVIQYQINIKQKAKLFFTQFYSYTFSFDSGYYEIALPFQENQLVALRVVLLEEVNCKPQPQQKKEDKMAEEVIKDEMDAEYLAAKNNEDFPCISDVYDIQNRNQNFQPEMKQQSNNAGGVEIECPFCCFKATSFTSKCPNCGEEWGEMGW